MAEVTVRAARANDARDLLRLLDQLGYADARSGFSERLARMLAEERADVLVAHDNDVLAGLATIFLVPVLHEDGPWCRITALVVDADHRGRRVGQALIAAAEDAARAAGCARVEATSALHRSEAHAFYRALGYEVEADHFLKRLTHRQ